MSVSEAQKKSRNKWDKENMKIVACKIKKEQAELFAQYAADHNTTVNALLREYILSTIEDY